MDVFSEVLVVHLTPSPEDHLAMSSLSQDVQRAAREAYGTVPNVLAEMNRYTGVPGAVYVAADEALSDGLLSPVEQQAVLLTFSERHASRYDAVIHARLGLDAGLSPRTIDRLLTGQLPRDERLRALVEAARQTDADRGWLESDVLQSLEERGVSRGELYEIFALYGIKTFSSFVNHLANTEVDEPLKALERDLKNVPEKPSMREMRRLVPR